MTGTSPLWEAASNADTAMVALLLSYSSNTSRTEPKTRTTPLHVAVAKGSDQVVKLLLAYGASAELLDKAGLSPKRAGAFALNPRVGVHLTTYRRERRTDQPREKAHGGRPMPPGAL